MRKLFLTTVVAGAFALSLPQAAVAAEFSCIPPVDTIYVGEPFTIDCMLDAQGESLNAFEGSLYLSPQITIQDVVTDGSIVPFWVDGPSIHTDNTVTFAGVLPGGYEGVLSPSWDGYRAGKVFTLTLLARTPGEGHISFNDDVHVYANDGAATRIDVSALGTTFPIASGYNPRPSSDSWGILVIFIAALIVLISFGMRSWRSTRHAH